jgi:hypothetical protein
MTDLFHDEFVVRDDSAVGDDSQSVKPRSEAADSESVSVMVSSLTNWPRRLITWTWTFPLLVRPFRKVYREGLVAVHRLG